MENPPFFDYGKGRQHFLLSPLDYPPARTDGAVIRRAQPVHFTVDWLDWVYSSDTPTHLVLYKAFPEIGGVVHTHSTYATAWAQAGCDIPNIGTTHADYFHDAIPCTADMTKEEVEGAYELETGNVIVKRFEGLNPVHTPGVLVKNHGPFSWGKDAHEAVHNAVVMEQVAKMASIAYAVNPNLTMNPLLIEKHFSRKHGPNAYYGQK